MMDFLKKYGAVPANNAGIQWAAATDEALCIHAEGAVKAWDNHRDVSLNDATDVRNELVKRLKPIMPAMKAGTLTEMERRMVKAWGELSTRFGD